MFVFVAYSNIIPSTNIKMDVKVDGNNIGTMLVDKILIMYVKLEHIIIKFNSNIIAML